MGRLYSVDFCCIFSFYMVIVSLSLIFIVFLLYIYIMRWSCLVSLEFTQVKRVLMWNFLEFV